MKRLVLALALAQLVWAETAAAPAEAEPYWREFRAAATHRNVVRVSLMTRFPLFCGTQRMNEMEFRRRFEAIFDARVRTCFLRATPVESQEGFEVHCGELTYQFERSARSFRFTRIAVGDGVNAP